MADEKYLAGMLFFFFFEFTLFSLYAAHNTAISCPEIIIPTNDTITAIFNNIGVIFNPCSGLPAWLYVIIFTPFAISLIIAFIPFI
jgi:hypothetical protein